MNDKTASATVRVTVKEPPPKMTKVVKKASPKKPPPKPKPIDLRWKQRKFMQLRMALLRSHGTDRLDEVMVYDKKKKRAFYYAVGDEFNGGELVFVHPRGGVVRRSGEYFLYPSGTWLDREINANDEGAGEHPTLQLVASRIRQADEEMAEREKAERESADAAAKAAKEVLAAEAKAAGEADAVRKEKTGEVAPQGGKKKKTGASATKPGSASSSKATSRPAPPKSKGPQASKAAPNKPKIGVPDPARRPKVGGKSKTKKPEKEP